MQILENLTEIEFSCFQVGAQESAFYKLHRGGSEDLWTTLRNSALKECGKIVIPGFDGILVHFSGMSPKELWMVH